MKYLETGEKQRNIKRTVRVPRLRQASTLSDPVTSPKIVQSIFDATVLQLSPVAESKQFGMVSSEIVYPYTGRVTLSDTLDLNKRRPGRLKHILAFAVVLLDNFSSFV